MERKMILSIQLLDLTKPNLKLNYNGKRKR
jgi:hypothetical protein